MRFKGQKIREIYTPVPKESPALGLSLQWMPLTSTGDVWHILDVAPKSPADLAGILPYGDYIIGSPEGVAKGESGLAELVEDVNREVIYSYQMLIASSILKGRCNYSFTTTNIT